jgi:hypothetical protein
MVPDLSCGSGSKVVEQNVAFKGPEDQEDFWEGERFEVGSCTEHIMHAIPHSSMST